MNKYKLLAFFRKFGLIRFEDKLRFYLMYLKTYSQRKQFLKENKSIKIPPAYHIYETFGLNLFHYYNDSIDTAKWVLSYFEKYKNLENTRILDWGCGTGRIIRHLPNLVPVTSSLYGTDYNEKYINWCKEYIPDVNFKLNSLVPPIDFEDNYFDVIYGISIFTHLSKELHYKWFNELMRVLKPEGIIFITLHGNAFKIKLTDQERENFEQGEIIVKANTKEGHRTFGAFHPMRFVKELIGKNQILEHIPGEISNGIPQQDIWIIKKV